MATNRLAIRNKKDLEKEKARLRLMVRYQQKDVVGLLVRFPGEFIATGIEDNLPEFAKRRIVYKLLDGIRITLGGALNNLFLPKEEEKANKNMVLSPFKKVRMFTSAFRAYKLIKRYKKR